MVDLTIVTAGEARTSDAEFAEIPSDVRALVDLELRREAFALLHEEAVARDELPAQPATGLDAPLARGMIALVQLGLGGVIGLFSVIAFLYLVRILAPGFV